MPRDTLSFSRLGCDSSSEIQGTEGREMLTLPWGDAAFSPMHYLALRVKTSKLQLLNQVSKPLGQPLLLQIISPCSDSVGLALLSSSETRLGKENPCSFPCEFASHYAIDFWDPIFTVSLHSPLQLSLTVSKTAWLNCIWESHTWSKWNTLPKYRPAYGKQEDCISFCTSLSWIPKPLAARKATPFAQALFASDNLQIQNMDML